jgi:uncharacterized protein YqcC (DUF446 family)
MALDNRAGELSEYLAYLEQVMADSGLWSESMPDAKALSSTQPFCLDTLSFEQWLQFVMIPTFKAMIFENVALPNQCQIEPMAEQMLKADHKSDMIFAIRSIDNVLTVS